MELFHELNFSEVEPKDVVNFIEIKKNESNAYYTEKYIELCNMNNVDIESMDDDVFSGIITAIKCFAYLSCDEDKFYIWYENFGVIQ